MNRIVPVLLLQDGLLVKTVKFKNPRYVGDPVNAVRIFNEKEVDELVVLNMDPCRSQAKIPFAQIEEIAGEAFMPVAYGGGVRTAAEARQLVELGVEKIVVNSAAAGSTAIVAEVASVLGSQAVVGGVDFKHGRAGTEAFTHGGRRRTRQDAVTRSQMLVHAGVGEIFLNSIDRDGTMLGFDYETIRQVSQGVPVPVLASGGAGSVAHLEAALQAGASAVAAASIFVFHGKHSAVLITYPERKVVSRLMQSTFGQ